VVRDFGHFHAHRIQTSAVHATPFQEVKGVSTLITPKDTTRRFSMYFWAYGLMITNANNEWMRLESNNKQQQHQRPQIWNAGGSTGWK